MLCNTCWDPSSAAVAVARAAITLSGIAAVTGPLLKWSASGEEGSAVWAMNAAGSLVGTEVGLWVNTGLSPLSGPSLPGVFQQHTDALGENITRISSRQSRTDASFPQLQSLNRYKAKGQTHKHFKQNKTRLTRAGENSMYKLKC